MAEPFTSYSVDNDKAFRNALKRASNTVQDFRVPFGLILSDFYKSEAAIFKLQSAGQYPDFVENGRAVGLKSRYAQAKIKAVGFAYPLLVRSGALAASLTGPNNKGSISSITKLSLEFGTSIKYGIYHQSDEERKKIPLRKFLFIGAEAKRFATSDQMGRLERWNNILSDYVLKAVAREGIGNG